MSFSLKNTVKRLANDVNPFDSPQPASTARPQPSRSPQFSPVAQQRIMARNPSTGAQQIASGPNTPSNVGFGQLHMVTNNVPASVPVSPLAQQRIQARTGRPAPTTLNTGSNVAPKPAGPGLAHIVANNFGVATGLAAERAGVGLGQGTSGLVDLASPGTGNSRVTNVLDKAATSLDKRADNRGVTQAYKTLQVPINGATFLTPGAVTGGVNETLQGAKQLPTALKVVRPVINAVNKGDQLVNKIPFSNDAVGRIAQAATHGVIKPTSVMNIANGTAQAVGTQAAHGQKVTPADVAKTAAMNTAFSILMPSALQAAAEGAHGLHVAGKAATAATKEATGQTFNGLQKKQVIMDTRKLDLLHNAKQDLVTAHANPALANDVNHGLRDLQQTHGLDFVTGSRGERLARIQQYLEQNGEAIPKLQAHQEKVAAVKNFAVDHPLGMTSGAVNDAGERIGMNGKPLKTTVAPAPSTKLVPPQSSEAIPAPRPAAKETGAVSSAQNTAESQFPLRMMEDPRTDPIQSTLSDLGTHDVKRNADVLASTSKNIAQNEDAALSLAKRGSSTEANAIAMQLMNKYLQEGNFEKARDLVQTVAPRFTRQGQETQILSQYSKLTPVGAVRYANSELAHAVQNTPKGKALEDTTVNAHQAIQGHAKEVANQVVTELSQGKIGKAISAVKEAKTPEQMLADRIKATGSKTNKPDPVKDMVNTLHQVAKEVLPQQGKKAPRDPMELIGQAVKDKANYKGVYEKAQRIVAEKYKDNPAALEELDKYFNSQVSRPFSKNQLNRGVQNGLQGTDLTKIVKQHFTKVDETGQELKDKLIQQAGLNKDEATQLADHIQSRYDELVKARKDSIIRQMFGDKPKPAQVSAADRILTMHNLGALSRDELRPLVAQKLGVPSLSEEATKNISGMANKIQTLTEGSPERMRATVEMMRYISDQVPQSASSKALSVWKAGLLSGVKTQQGNAISNGLFATLKKVSDVPAVLADKAISLKTGQRTVGLTMRGGGQGTAKGFKTGLDTLMTGIDMRDPISSGKYEQHSELKLNNKLANNLIAKPTNLVFRGMSAADQPWYYGAEGNSIMDQAKAQGINQGLRRNALQDYMTQAAQRPSEAIQARASQESGKAVLGYDTVASRAISAVGQSIENSTMSPAGKAAARTVINVLAPFTKVPSAFISRTVDFTPLGIPKTVISQVSHGQFDQRALSQAIGEATTGSALIALGVALSQKNLVSGDYPKGDQKEAERWKAEGITPNSLKIGNKWVSMNYMGPVGLLFNAGHQIAQAGQKGEGAMTKAFAAAGGLGQGLLGQSFLQGFSGFTNAVTDPQQSAKKYINSQAASIVPSIVNDAANVTDKFQRQANGVTDSIKNRIPGLRESNAIKQDVYGNTLKQPAGQLNTLNGLKPSDSTTNKSPSIAEVNRLHTVNPNDKALQATPTPIGKSITVDKQNVKLTDKQAYDLQKQAGQRIQSDWNKLIKTPEYKAADDTQKAAMLNNAKGNSQEDIQRAYVVNNNLGTYSKPESAKAIAQSQGGDIASLSSSKATGGNVSSIAPKLDTSNKQFLTKYNAMSADDRKKAATTQNDFEYKTKAAQYANDKANNKLTRAQDISTQQSVAKAKVGSSFSKDTRDLYGLSKPEVYNLITSDPNGKQIANDLLKYGDALQAAGVATNKFRTSKGATAFQPKQAGSSSSSGGTSSKKNISSFISMSQAGRKAASNNQDALLKLVRGAKIAGKNQPRVKVASVTLKKQRTNKKAKATA